MTESNQKQTDFIVSVSPEERANGQFSVDTERALMASMKDNGLVVLRSVFDTKLIDDAAREFSARYGMMNIEAMEKLAQRPPPNSFLMVGHARFEATLKIRGAFAEPGLFANPLLLSFFSTQLGNNIHLSSMSVVVSHPGAAQQHIHRDAEHIFPEVTSPAPGDLPVYGINLAVPLVDVSLESGPTAFWLGSHKWPKGKSKADLKDMTQVPFQRGDCVLIDYRTLHSGMPNRGLHMRPVLYMVYVRNWFFDEENFFGRIPLDGSPDDLVKIPEQYHPLLKRSFSQILRSHWEDASFETPKMEPLPSFSTSTSGTFQSNYSLNVKKS